MATSKNPSYHYLLRLCQCGRIQVLWALKARQKPSSKCRLKLLTLFVDRMDRMHFHLHWMSFLLFVTYRIQTYLQIFQFSFYDLIIMAFFIQPLIILSIASKDSKRNRHKKWLSWKRQWDSKQSLFKLREVQLDCESRNRQRKVVKCKAKDGVFSS